MTTERISYMKNKSTQLASRSWPLGLKMVACLLSTLLFLYAVPTNVFAELIDAIDTATDSNDEQTTIEETESGKEGSCLYWKRWIFSNFAP